MTGLADTKAGAGRGIEMRFFAIVGTLALMIASGPAAAAEAGWIEDFKRICAGHPSNFDASITEALADGYALTAGPVSGMNVYTKAASADGRMLIVSERYSSQFSNDPEMHTRTCGISLESDYDPRADITRWIGLKPFDADGVESYLFYVVDGRRVTLVGAPDDTTEAAFRNGGYWYVGASHDGETATVTLTHFKPPE